MNTARILFDERSSRSCRRIVHGVALAAAVGHWQPAAAQELGEQSVVGLEEVIVTARKRAESLQDTPISITALSAEQMQERNIVTLADVSRATPNLIFDAGTGNTGGATNAQVFIRGIGQTDFLFTTDPGVGIYVDEVYFPRSLGAVLELADFERVEVLRGPQGTLFGKNTIGGALNIVTRKPGAEFAGDAELTFGSRNRTDGRFAVDLPIAPGVFAARLSGVARKQDGYVKRVNAGDELGDIDMQGARLVAEWTPSQAWDVTFALDGTRRRESAIALENAAPIGPSTPADNAILFLWNTFVAPAFGAAAPYDNRYIGRERENLGTGPAFSDLDVWGASVTARYTFGSNTFKSISAYRQQSAKFGADVDHSPLRYMEQNNDNDQDQLSQELQLSGVSADDRLKWVAGAFYFRENATDYFNILFGEGLFAAFEALPAPLIPLAPGVTCPPPPGVFAPCVGGAGNPFNPVFDLDAVLFNDLAIRSYAAYGQATYALTDALSLTGGLRYTSEEKELFAFMRRNASGVFAVPPSTLKRDWDSVSPRIGLEYQSTPERLYYLSAARGFKGGGFNGRATAPEQVDSFDPEFVRTYEAGLKSEWFNRRLRLNAAIYQSDYTDMQLTSVRDVGGVIVAVTENVGKSRIRGFELESAVQMTPRALLSVGAGYTDAEYRQLDAGATVTLDNRFPKIPEWTLNAALSYDVPLGSFGSLALVGDVSHRSAYFSDVPNSAIGYEDGFEILGLRATLKPSGRFWEIALFGSNLSDSRHILSSINSYGSFGTGDRTYGRPREWGVSFGARF